MILHTAVDIYIQLVNISGDKVILFPDGGHQQQWWDAVWPAAWGVLLMLTAEGMELLHGKDWCFPLASLPVTVREKIGGWMNFWPNPVCLFLCFKDTVNYART